MPKYPKPWHRKSRGVWYVEIDGKQINLGPVRDEAFRKYHAMMAQPRQRAVPSESLAVLIDLFLGWCEKHRAPDTYQWYRSRLQVFVRRYPNLSVQRLRPFHVQEWLDSMPVANGTRRNYGRSIKRCLRWSRKMGYIDTNPIADLELPKGGKREQVLSEEDFEQVLQLTPDESFRELLLVTWDSGCRPQESLRVEARHVDLSNQRWVFPESESKGNLPRIVYLTDRALEITRRRVLRYPDGPLFRNGRGVSWSTDAVNCAFQRNQVRLGKARMEEQGLSITAAEIAALMPDLNPVRKSKGVERQKTVAELRHEAKKKLTQKLAGKLGEKYSLYSLRHTWMNRMLKNGVDALTVAFLAGHADPSTAAKVYAHLSQDPGYLLSQAKKGVG